MLDHLVYNVVFLNRIVLFGVVEAVLMSTYNLCFKQKSEKLSEYLSENFQFLVVKSSIYLNRRIFEINRSGTVVLVSFTLNVALCLLTAALVSCLSCSLCRIIVFCGSCLALPW